ncbi:MAG: hypothetical protein LRS48_04580 [Desulfurococcales archaeon]|nr:hypothetical protein [Desulfurococcales archaeon]
MRRIKATDRILERLAGIAEFQFSEKVARAWFDPSRNVEVEVNSRGSIRGVFVDGKRVATLRPTDGLFSLAIDGAVLLVGAEDPPRFRVIANMQRPLSGSILVGDVVDLDPDLRPGDEVVVVDESDTVIGVGRLRIPKAMLDGLARGEVARLRKKTS